MANTYTELSMNRLLFTFLFILSCAVAHALPDIEWLSKEYHFGVIREADGPADGEVKFINRGAEPTYISRVRPGCGCTAASYTTDIIAPGDTAKISFSYNPLGRPGSFEKTIRVYIGDENAMSTIRLTGNVIGSSATLKGSYPIERGDIRFQRDAAAAGELKKGQSRHLFINVYNQGNHPFIPVWKTAPKPLSVEFTPDTLSPGEIGTFSFYLRSSEEPAYGPVEYPVTITGEGMEPTTVNIRAVIVPDTKDLSPAEFARAPQAFLLPEFIDFGYVEGDKTMPFEIGVLNDGGSLLTVEKAYSRSDAVDILKVCKSVKAGKSRSVKGKLRISEIPEGPFRISVDIVTNDPVHPLRTCTLTGIKK